MKTIAKQYLIENERMNEEDAEGNAENVYVFEGSAEDYAQDLIEADAKAKLGVYAKYLDYKKLGRDMVLNGDIVEFVYKGVDYIIVH